MSRSGIAVITPLEVFLNAVLKYKSENSKKKNNHKKFKNY